MHKSELIEVYPGAKEIWGINSHRQVFYMNVDLSQIEREAAVNYYRDISNVQRVLVGERHKLCVKAVKHLAIPREQSSSSPAKCKTLVDTCLDQILDGLVFYPIIIPHDRLCRMQRTTGRSPKNTTSPSCVPAASSSLLSTSYLPSIEIG